MSGADEVAKVAGALTKAQREAVLSFSKRGGARLAELVQVNLPKRIVEKSPAAGTASLLRLTRFGLRVRAHLAAQENADAQG